MIRSRAGFTVLELLVVIAVLILLAAVLFPVLARARGAAQRTQCLSQLGQLARAHAVYVQDWDDQFPEWAQPGPPWRFWPELLRPYVRDARLFRDPAAVRKPSAQEVTLLADYTLLTWQQGGRRDDPGEPAQRWPGPPLSLADVVRSAETISLMDGSTTTRSTQGGVLRHSRGMNAAFVDGHVRWLSRDELWRVDRDERGVYWLHYGSAHR
jgi:prepilin-type processing-associated H-X9-DG protein